MQSALRVIGKYLVQILLLPFWLFPVQKKKILFVNCFSNCYTCNPKYVCEYLLKHRGQTYQYWYVTQKPEVIQRLKEKGVHTIAPKSISFFYHALTCGVFLTNGGSFSFLPMRPSQYVVNTWHGGGAYKKMGLDHRKKDFWNIADCKINADKTNCFVSSCHMFSKMVQSGLYIRPQSLCEIGMPRNDIFFRPTAEIRRQTLQKLGLSQEMRYLLYAPTFRSYQDNVLLEKNSVLADIDIDGLKQALGKKFGGEWHILVKLHPLAQKIDTSLPPYFTDVSHYDDMQELLCAADVLLNDYSSSMWDFALTGKPCFLLAEDYEHYRETAGLYLNWKELPFPFAASCRELIKNILAFEEESYRIRLQSHFQQMGSFETGSACQQLVARIEQRMER